MVAALWKQSAPAARPLGSACVVVRAASLVSLVLAYLLCSSLPVHAAPPLSHREQVQQQLLETLRKPGDLTLRDTSLSQAIFTIGERWQINVVVGDDVEGKVNGVFRAAPLYEILDAILAPGGYGYYPVGNGLVIKPTAGEDDVNPFFRSQIISLRAARPEDVIQGLQQLGSRQGRLQALPSAHSLLVTDYPDRIALMRAMAEQIDNAAAGVLGATGEAAGQLQMFQYSPQFIEAKSLKESIASLLTKDGRLAVMELENRIIVFDYPSSLAIVRQAMLELDVPAPQVRITALIYDISLEDIEQIGVNWSHAVKWQHNPAGDATGLVGLDTITEATAGAAVDAAAAATDPSGALTVMNLSRSFDITAVVQLLKQANDARLLADPTVTVVNREQAKIQIVTEIPFQQLTQTQQGGNIGTTSFREAGVTMTVVPFISDDGTIKMVVTPSFSRLTGFTTGVSPQPIIDKREAQTTVRVANGQTFVIGGLRQRTEVGAFTGVPYLMNMKFCHVDFGKLFRARDTNVRESELIVFLRPEIVTPFDCGRERENDALTVGNNLLESIPQASVFTGPFCSETNLGTNAGDEPLQGDGVPATTPQPAYGTGLPPAEVIPTPGRIPAGDRSTSAPAAGATNVRPNGGGFVAPLNNGQRPWYNGNSESAKTSNRGSANVASSPAAAAGPSFDRSTGALRRTPAIDGESRQQFNTLPWMPAQPAASSGGNLPKNPRQREHRRMAPSEWQTPRSDAATPAALDWRTMPPVAGGTQVSRRPVQLPTSGTDPFGGPPPKPAATAVPAQPNRSADLPAARTWGQDSFRY